MNEKLHTVSLSINRALVEDHDVLREGSCLVREDELHLAQLLIQSGGASFSCGVHLTVVHLPVPVDEVAVTEPQDLHAEGRRVSRHTFRCGETLNGLGMSL